MLPPPGGHGPSCPHQVLPLSAPQVAQADWAYHDVRRFCGLYYLLQRSGAVERTARAIDIASCRPAGGGAPTVQPSRLPTAAARVVL
jgi:hypothetical protein